ncbi:pyridine nucleotide-disulfide oxidoreductase [Meridianimarinicoccus roseus]|uniref:Pyridine nucleotide-disulfide oxidoreductase n=1 Tax=Meridianimarinicoccus roseus TaxID=2072018 RepID=A0A2V2LB98_9RHOB|nr:FAD-dependent oxidoreductase [Meridianimarinicoccus roseus]PWR00971.1 pyridine nucleotide-disulfide oxidoreductase [Meridianimarinicoccus roseus]
MDNIVVIGAGQAGSALCAKLRELGFGGALTLVGEEPVPPYQRPPLSKKYMLGDMALDRMFLRPEAFYADRDIALRLGTRADALDTVARRVTLSDGTTLAYDALALTTGAPAMRLPAAIGGALRGVHTMRTLDDADALARECTPGRHMLVIGGGYIGLEAAAVAAGRGLSVTLVEQAPRILARVAAPETADWFRALHAAHGVRIIEGTGVAQLTETEGRFNGAELTDGRRIDADFAVVGIGIRPATALAEAAGIAINNGIAVDELGRTSAPGIWAAGDCASFPHRGGRLRLESVPNAIEHSEATAAAMLGGTDPYVAKPWFWSDQYDVKLQIAGLNTGYDRVVVRDDAGARSHWYYGGDTLLSVDAMNNPRAYMVAKRMIEAGQSPAPARVTDPALTLKDLLAA